MGRRRGARGGYQKPSPATPPGGPGRFSRRTDAQAVKSPDLDRPDVQYGDVQRLTEAQRAVPVPKAQSPAPGGGAASARPGGGGAGLPPWLFGMGSSRPAEPVTDGLDMGPGRGSDALSTPPPRDDRQAILEYLVHTYGNADAEAMLSEMRGSQASASAPTPPSGAPPSAAPAPPDMGSGMEAADGGLV